MNDGLGGLLSVTTVTPELATSRPADGETDERTDESSADEGEAASTGGALPKDVIFDLLRVKRRREVLRFLEETGGQTSLSDVAEHIAALENDIDIGQLSSHQRKRVYVGLYQCHLPKMDAADVIEYDKARSTIEFGPAAAQLFPYLYLDPTATDEAETGAGLVRRAFRRVVPKTRADHTATNGDGED